MSISSLPGPQTSSPESDMSTSRLTLLPPLTSAREMRGQNFMSCPIACSVMSYSLLCFQNPISFQYLSFIYHRI